LCAVCESNHTLEDDKEPGWNLNKLDINSILVTFVCVHLRIEYCKSNDAIHYILDT